MFIRFPNFDKHLHTMELIVVEVTNTYPTRFAKEKKGHMLEILPHNKHVTKEKERNVEGWGTTYSATGGYGGMGGTY
jgi:hypothetical protein